MDMRSRPGARGARGFTLIEVMVALVVFAVGVLSLAMLIPLGTKGISRSGETTRASELSVAAMEKLLATPYDDDDLTAGTHTDTANPYNGSYYITWVVEVDQPITSCKRITVRVRWPMSNSATNVRLVGVKPASS
jgi:type IV pilus assembly protein PilV